MSIADVFLEQTIVTRRSKYSLRLRTARPEAPLPPNPGPCYEFRKVFLSDGLQYQILFCLWVHTKRYERFLPNLCIFPFSPHAFYMFCCPSRPQQECACFDSSSARQFVHAILYGVLFVHFCKQSSSWKSVFEHTLPPAWFEMWAFRWLTPLHFITVHRARNTKH
jgi:hypothetical protein